jgi:hypothetical protein
MNDNLVKDFIEKYFNQALKSFFDYQRQLEDQARMAHGLPASFPSVATWTEAMLAPLTGAMSKGQGSQPETPKADPAQELRAMISELQAQVSDLKQGQEKKPRKPRRRK